MNLDRLSEVDSMTPREAARHYARAGLRVFPLGGGAKGTLPRISGWPDRATTDVAQIDRWEWPAVGILTGPGSSVVVLDIDPRNGGWASRDALVTKLGWDHLPRTLTARSGGLPVDGRPGYHLYFTYDGLWPAIPSKRLADGLDVKSRGNGYVVAPPSRRKDTGRAYRWAPRRGGSLAPWPTEWCDLDQARREMTYAGRAIARATEPLGDGLVTYLITKMRDAEPGERNRALYAAARAMAERRTSDRRLLVVLGELADAATDAGLDANEIDWTIRSAVGAAGRVGVL